MKKICCLLTLVMVLSMMPLGVMAEAAHTPGAWGYHPACHACGSEMATWGQCTSCFGWCGCYTGYCSASMMPAENCTKHDGNCPLLVIAGTTGEPAAEVPVHVAEEETAAIADYASREEIINSSRVFMLDELHHVVGCVTEERDGLKYYKVTFEDGIISHGTDGDSADWFYGGGMLSDFEVDLDADGVNEYVTVTWYQPYDMYDQPYIYVNVYEPVEGGYDKTASVPVPGGSYAEVEIWLVSGSNGWHIMSDTIDRGDGASCYARVMVYGYDGENAAVVKAMGVDNYSGGVFIGANEDALGTYNYIYSSYSDPSDTTELPVEFFGGYSEEPSGNNFSAATNAFAEYGVQVNYDDYDIEFLGARKVFHFCGRHDGHVPDADLAYGVLSSQDHSSGDMTAAPEENTGSLDFFGIGKVIDEQPVEEESEYFIADSGERLLTREELSVYTKEELGFIRNEILARYGYPFKKEMYREHFESTSWYVRNEGFVYSMLNEIEMKNVELIKSME